MAKILSVYNRLQAGDYENGNGGKRRVNRLTQFMHATLQLSCYLCMLGAMSLVKCNAISDVDHYDGDDDNGT